MWKELGEKPILWTNLKLKFNAFKEDEEDEKDEEDEEDTEDEKDDEDEEDKDDDEDEEDRDEAPLLIRGWTDDLAQVLVMERLQSLKHLTLDFHTCMDWISWQDCMQFLLVVHHFAPSVKKLSWRESTIRVTPNPFTYPVFQLARQLVEILVKFKEVHFSSSSSTLSTYSFDEDALNPLFFPKPHRRRFGNGINSAILRALPGALDGEGSELKVLTLHCQGFYDPADLADARKKLTVNMI